MACSPAADRKIRTTAWFWRFMGLSEKSIQEIPFETVFWNCVREADSGQ
jgi:hypothetical protein